MVPSRRRLPGEPGTARTARGRPDSGPGRELGHVRVRVQRLEPSQHRAQSCVWGDGGAAAFRGLSWWA